MTASGRLKIRKRYYTPAEIGRMAGVSRQTVVRMIRDGEIKAEATPGGHFRIPTSEITTNPNASTHTLELDFTKA